MKKVAKFSPSALSMGNDPADIDDLPPLLRELVHEFGWSVVRAFLDSGVSNPKTIRTLIHVSWTGPREAANAKTSPGCHRSIQQFEQFLLRSGCGISARALIGLIRQQSLALLPREPTTQMIEEAGTTPERLRKAIRKAEQHMWPFLETSP